MSDYLPLDPGMRVRNMERWFVGTVEEVGPCEAIVRWDHSGIAYKRNRKHFHRDTARKTGCLVIAPNQPEKRA